MNQQDWKVNAKGTAEWIPLPEPHTVRAGKPGCAVRKGNEEPDEQSGVAAPDPGT